MKLQTQSLLHLLHGTMGHTWDQNGQWRAITTQYLLFFSNDRRTDEFEKFFLSNILQNCDIKMWTGCWLVTSRFSARCPLEAETNFSLLLMNLKSFSYFQLIGKWWNVWQKTSSKYVVILSTDVRTKHEWVTKVKVSKVNVFFMCHHLLGFSYF